MTVTIKPQLTILSLSQLQSAASAQSKRVDRIKNLVAGAEKRIAEAAANHKMPEPPVVAGFNAPVYTREQKQIFEQAFQRANGQIRRNARKELDAEVQPLLRACYDASTEAKQRAERHYDKWSILRRATGTTGGMLPATQMRAAYAEMFEQSGPVELARWAQQAVDTGDPILADSVIRANNDKPVNERSFNSASLLAALPNAEFDELQAVCTAIIVAAEEAGLAWSEFERDRPDAMRRIAVGLRKQLHIKDAGQGGAN